MSDLRLLVPGLGCLHEGFFGVQLLPQQDLVLLHVLGKATPEELSAHLQEGHTGLQQVLVDVLGVIVIAHLDLPFLHRVTCGEVRTPGWCTSWYSTSFCAGCTGLGVYP